MNGAALQRSSFVRLTVKAPQKRRTLNTVLLLSSATSTLSNFSPQQSSTSILSRTKSTHAPPSTFARRRSPVESVHPSFTSTRRERGQAIGPLPSSVVVSSSTSPQPSHFAAPQPPPPHNGAPRLIRHPPLHEEATATHYSNPAYPVSSSSLQHNSLYSYTRGPTSRLFSFRNSTASSSASHSLPSLSNNSSSLASTTTMVDIGTASSLPRNRASAAQKAKQNGKVAIENQDDEHHQHQTGHKHTHSGSSWFGHSHAGHSHGAAAEGSAEEADRLLKALKGKGDRGSNITVVGLIANLVLCGAKGAAGVLLHSASLLADAAHSLSDTFSDLVTLFCWKMSQRPASPSHPLGYGKFETMGGLGVSVVLVAGAFAIGMHSYSLLLEVLQPHMSHMPSGLQAFGTLTGDLAKAAGGLLHDHHHHAGATPDAAGQILSAAQGAKASSLAGHAHGHADPASTENLLDPNAMWFALISVLIKEWLYHATLKIAREEKSSVLEANAIHHRSDSLSSGVTFLAIGGSYMGFPVLDPLGGLLVAGLIGKQGIELLINALADLSDRGVQPEVLDDFERALQDTVDEDVSLSNDQHAAQLLGWKDLRAVRSGVSTFVDVTLLMDEDVPLRNARLVEAKVRDKLTAAVKGVKEVRIHLDTT